MCHKGYRGTGEVSKITYVLVYPPWGPVAGEVLFLSQGSEVGECSQSKCHIGIRPLATSKFWTREDE